MKLILLIISLLAVGTTARAGALKQANPENYRRLLATLAPGDTLVLAPGVYDRGLPISNCHGAPERWITIQGPQTGVAEIRQTQAANCVELRQCSYVALKRLSIVGEGSNASRVLFGISAKGGLENKVHHILIEDCLISDWRGSQQAVGISTKTPTWDWTIRRNIIRNCGTGLYLGNANGADPFIRGLIEHNLVMDPIGYCMEIKYQKPRPNLPDMPTAASSTIIRHNVFIKNDAPSPDGSRPNVLVGGFPESGPGAEDWYEIYGNVFWHNPRESLLQASGRVSIHDNLFVNCPSVGHAAITLRSHDLPLKRVHLYHNTIVAAARGIRVGNAAPEGNRIIGNIIFADEPLALHRAISQVSENLTGPVAAAAQHLAKPVPVLGEVDLHPKPGRCEGPPLDLSVFAREQDFAKDFDGRPRNTNTARGAYAGPATQQSWRLQADRKPMR